MRRTRKPVKETRNSDLICDRCGRNGKDGLAGDPGMMLCIYCREEEEISLGIDGIVGIEIPCSRCGALIDIWDWKKGDPVPKEVICETCLTHKEHAALDWN